jgi:hypothetical protein
MVESPASLSLVNPRDWANGVGALTFAARGPRAPLLLTDEKGELPRAVRSYLGELRAREPSQLFAFGDEASLAAPLLAELDALLGKGPRDAA